MNETDFDAPPSPEELQGELRRAVDAIRSVPPPAAQFDAWQLGCSQATVSHDSRRATVPARKRTTMRRLITVTAAAAVLAGIWLCVSNFTASGPGRDAFAQTLEQIQKAKTMTWKTTFYEHSTSKEGKSTWLYTAVVECAYRAPGLYREVRRDKDGQVRYVEIEDRIQGRKLTYAPKEKTATLAKTKPVSHDSGPFAYYRAKLSAPNLEWIGRRRTASAEVNVFRCAFRDHDNECDRSVDFWIDAETKQLVDIYQPGADIYDPEKDPVRNTPPGDDAWSGHMMGCGQRDIRYDVALDDSLFRLEPPEGYAIEVKQRDRVTEKDMIDYFGILADFNDKMFPDQAFPTPFNLVRKINVALQKPRKDLTAAERNLLEADARYGGSPILVFLTGDFDSRVEKSFRYLGKGVKLGDKDRIVCWYKPKDAEDRRSYRVVYGDLSVKDVAPEDLPLPVDVPRSTARRAIGARARKWSMSIFVGRAQQRGRE